MREQRGGGEGKRGGRHICQGGTFAIRPQLDASSLHPSCSSPLECSLLLLLLLTASSSFALLPLPSFLSFPFFSPCSSKKQSSRPKAVFLCLFSFFNRRVQCLVRNKPLSLLWQRLETIYNHKHATLLPPFSPPSIIPSSICCPAPMDKVQSKLRVRNELGRALLGEFLGTFLLVLIIGCVCAQAILPKPALNQTIGINLGVGLGIAFGVAVCAKVSGGHINPAVSLMFLSFKQLAPLRFVLYSLVQLVGAFFGAAVAYLVYRDAINKFDGGTRQVYGTKATAHIFASYSAAHLGVFNGFIDQVVATAIFCLAIAHITDKRNHYPSYLQPFLVGTSFVMVGTAFAYNAGYPCNPARDFGPRLFTLIVGYGWEVFSYNDYCWFWVPLLAPFVGALLGAWLYQFFIGIHVPAEEQYEIVTTTITTTTKPQGELQPLAPAKEHNEQA